MTGPCRYFCSGFYPKRRGLWLVAEFPTPGLAHYVPSFTIKALTARKLAEKAYERYERMGYRSVSLSENYRERGGGVVGVKRHEFGSYWHREGCEHGVFILEADPSMWSDDDVTKVLDALRRRGMRTLTDIEQERPATRPPFGHSPAEASSEQTTPADDPIGRKWPEREATLPLSMVPFQPRVSAVAGTSVRATGSSTRRPTRGGARSAK